MPELAQRSKRRPFLWLLWLVCLVMLGGQLQIGMGASSLPQSGTVVQVFDGDTVRLRSGEKVRYLGIDTPELDHEPGGCKTQCYGPEAREANQRLVLHRTVRLEYDRGKRDRYGRLLAYVLLPDGRLINEELIRSGYAVVFRTSQGFSRLDGFLNAQRDAIRNSRGLWSHCRVKEESRYIGNRNSYVFHRPDCEFGRRINLSNRIEFDSRLQAFDAGFRQCRRCLP